MIYAAIDSRDISAFFVDNDKGIAMIILKCGEKLILPISVVQSNVTKLSNSIKRDTDLNILVLDHVFGLGMDKQYITRFGDSSLVQHHYPVQDTFKAEPKDILPSF